MTSTGETTLAVEKVPVGAGRLDLHVTIGGAGPPLFYLEIDGALSWTPFLDRLARNNTVYAPHLPGTGPSEAGAISAVEDLFDLVLLYEELSRTMNITGSVLVGASAGGMLACELAATYPNQYRALVAIAPLGLWRDDVPVKSLLSTLPTDLPALLFHDPESHEAQAFLALPEQDDAIPAAIAGHVWAIGCAAKFTWPLPDLGLDRRLHRIGCPTLIVWGKDDVFAPPAYAEEFARRIKRSDVAIIESAGHLPHIECVEQTASGIATFIASLGHA